MLKPMNDTVFGSLVSDEGFDDLTRLFLEVSESFKDEVSSLGHDQVAIAERQTVAQLSEKKNLHYMAEITAVGPDCRELAVGDIAILPPYGGSMVTIINENNEPERVFAISESAVLARWRD